MILFQEEREEMYKGKLLVAQLPTDVHLVEVHTQLVLFGIVGARFRSEDDINEVSFYWAESADQKANHTAFKYLRKQGASSIRCPDYDVYFRG